MEATRPELTTKDRSTLRRFVRVIDEMNQCRFIKSVRTEDQKMSGRVDEQGNMVVTGPTYDWEDFRSFVTWFRQVALNKRDRTYFTKVLDIVKRYASEEFREVLVRNEDAAVARLEGFWTGIQVGHEVDGKATSYNVTELLDAIVNGDVAHPDARHEAVIDLLDRDRRALLWPVIHFKIRPVLNMMTGLFHDLWKQNILTTEDYPPAWQALKIEWDNRPDAGRSRL